MQTSIKCEDCNEALCFTPSDNSGSGEPASGSGLDQINGSVRFQNRPKTRPAASWWAKPIPISVNPRVLPRLARPVSSNLQFSFSGFSIYCHIQIFYCHVQYINFGTSLSLFVLLAAIIIKTSREMLPATS